MTEVLAYWISTSLLCLLYLTSATTYLIKGSWVRGILAEFGYPSYLVPLLVVAKLLAVAAILSRVNVALSDLAYAGMFYHLLLSAIAYIGVRKPIGSMPAAVGLTLLAVSFLTQNATREPKSPYSRATEAHHIIANSI